MRSGYTPPPQTSSNPPTSNRYLCLPPPIYSYICHYTISILYLLLHSAAINLELITVNLPTGMRRKSIVLEACLATIEQNHPHSASHQFLSHMNFFSSREIPLAPKFKMIFSKVVNLEKCLFIRNVKGEENLHTCQLS